MTKFSFRKITILETVYLFYFFSNEKEKTKQNSQMGATIVDSCVGDSCNMGQSLVKILITHTDHIERTRVNI